MREHYTTQSWLMSTALVFCLVTLSACGGGNSSSASSSSFSSSSSASSEPVEDNTPPVVDAGENVSVTAGAQVFLEGSASDSDGEIVNRKWVQTSGPRVPLTVEDIDAGYFSFFAPNTGTSATATMRFMYTATDNDGAAESDTLEVTVSRINQPPVVQTSGLIVVNEAEVTLSATAYDPDGEVESYYWQQTAGEPAFITSSGASSTTVTLPDVSGETSYEFLVEVTDDEGLTASDTLTVVAANENAPQVHMDFPPPRGAYSANSISAFGTVAASDGASIQTVEVTAGENTVFATLDDSGHWRADNILLPEAASEVTVTVQATDSESRSNYAESQLVLRENFAIGSSDTWGQTTALVISPDKEEVWLLAEGAVGEDYKLMAVDLETGFRTNIVTDFTQESLGPVARTYTAMIFDDENGVFYLSAGPEEEQEYGSLYTVDELSGERQLIQLTFEENDVGMVAPRDMYLYETGDLYIADLFGQILRVDTETGASQVVADMESVSEGIIAPTQMAWDINQEQFVVMQENTGAVDMLGVSLGNPATSTMISEGAEISFGPTPLESAEGLAIDQSQNRAFVLTSQANNVTEVNLVTGERAILLENFGKEPNTGRDITYDTQRNILYGVAGQDYDQALYMIDPESGSKVTISTSF